MALTKVTGELINVNDLDLTNVGAIQADSIAGDADTNTALTFSGSDVITVTTGGSTAFTVDASQVVNLSQHLTLVDDKKIKLGAGDDLQIYHDGTHSYVKDDGQGNLILQGSNLRLAETDNTLYAFFTSGAGGEFYYDGSKKFETTSTGVTVTGDTDTDTLTVSGNATVGGTLGVTGALTVGDGHTIGDDGDDNLTIASSANENIIIDSADDIILDADGGDIVFKDGGSTIGYISNSSNNFQFLSNVSDADIVFKGVDGGSTITALTLDMSAAGQASFNAGITSAEAITVTNGNSTFSTASSWGAGLTIKQTNDDASPAYLSLHKDPASGHSTIADNDYIGFINMKSVDGNGNAHTYVELSGVATNVSHGGETSKFSVNTWGAGTEYSSNLVVSGGQVAINGVPSTYNANARDLVIRSYDGGNVGMTLSCGANNDGFIGFSNGEDTGLHGLIQYDHATDAMHFRTNDVDSRLTIDSAGKVGIGNASPSYKLDVNTSGNASAFRISNSTNGQDLNCAIANSGTSSGDDTLLALSTTNGAGDPYIRMSISGVEDWHIGVDNSDSDNLHIGRNSSIGSGTKMVLGNDIAMKAGGATGQTHLKFNNSQVTVADDALIDIDGVVNTGCLVAVSSRYKGASIVYCQALYYVDYRSATSPVLLADPSDAFSNGDVDGKNCLFMNGNANLRYKNRNGVTNYVAITIIQFQGN